jgi:hypothetical protein
LATGALPGEGDAMDRKNEAANRPITPQTRMGEIIERWPQTVALLVASGFAPLADPAHQKMVKGLPVTLEMACAKHGLSLEELLERLNAAVAG